MPGAKVRERIESLFGRIEGEPHTLAGGDINEIWLVNTASGKIVLKTRKDPYPGMFRAEAHGLQVLRSAAAFRIPEVYEVQEGYLLLEYIPQGRPQDITGEQLGHTLAALHRKRNAFYGFDRDNYIGTLPQSNARHHDAVRFYREERLLPQFELAVNNGYTFGNLEAFLQKLEALIPEEPASLIHGDLWAGNFMVSREGDLCLIDPAASYASREMDLAMMALFGGFPKSHTGAYHEAFPLQPSWEERIPLWQLYYILVHLNLFGAGYYSRCVQIMKRYL